MRKPHIYISRNDSKWTCCYMTEPNGAGFGIWPIGKGDDPVRAYVNWSQLRIENWSNHIKVVQ